MVFVHLKLLQTKEMHIYFRFGQFAMPNDCIKLNFSFRLMLDWPCKWARKVQKNVVSFFIHPGADPFNWVQMNRFSFGTWTEIYIDLNRPNSIDNRRLSTVHGKHKIIAYWRWQISCSHVYLAACAVNFHPSNNNRCYFTNGKFTTTNVYATA